ncbi:hypothetical protein NDU88_005727, partial [Pleurodeles waltl]
SSRCSFSYMSLWARFTRPYHHHSFTFRSPPVALFSAPFLQAGVLPLFVALS